MKSDCRVTCHELVFSKDVCYRGQLPDSSCRECDSKSHFSSAFDHVQKPKQFALNPRAVLPQPQLTPPFQQIPDIEEDGRGRTKFCSKKKQEKSLLFCIAGS